MEACLPDVTPDCPIRDVSTKLSKKRTLQAKDTRNIDHAVGILESLRCRIYGVSTSSGCTAVAHRRQLIEDSRSITATLLPNAVTADVELRLGSSLTLETYTEPYKAE